MLLFHTPWKHQKTYRFSDVFRGYRKATLDCNGLSLTMKAYMKRTDSFTFYFLSHISANRKWSKIGAWFVFWLNVNEIHSPKNMESHRDPVFQDSALILFASACMKYISRVCLYIIYYVFPIVQGFDGILVGSQWFILSYQNVPCKRLNSLWLVWLISAIRSVFRLEDWDVSKLIWVEKSLFRVLWTWFLNF